jgi:hypothetical protein
MTKLQKDRSGFLPFSIPTLDLVPFKKALSKAIKSSPKSRDQVADDISALLRKRVTVDELNSWTAESKLTHLPRADELLAFIAVTGRPDPLDAMAAVIRHECFGPRDAEILHLAKLQRRRALLDREIALLDSVLDADEDQSINDRARSKERAE